MRRKGRTELAELGFEPRPRVFDRIEIRRIGWKVKQRTANRSQEISDFGMIMETGIVHNKTLTWAKMRYEMRFNPFDDVDSLS